MQFSLTKEQISIRKAAREFAVKELGPVARELDSQGRFDNDLWQKAAELGFLGVFVPETYDGLGMGYFDQCLILEEFARVDLGMAHTIESTFFGSQMLLLFGTEEQKQKYLPSICDGELWCGVSVTEPDAGSDVTAVSTTALKEDGQYVINGNKAFTTNCSKADILIVLCATDPENPKKHQRFSTIIVETDRPGYSSNAYHDKLSLRCAETGDAFFKNVKVPEDHLLGEEGRGFYNVMEFFNRTRVLVSSFGVGTAQGALDKAMEHACQREQFGKPLSALQMVQGKIAEMATLTEAARSLYYRAAALLDAGTGSNAQFHGQMVQRRNRGESRG